jgi:hypothetical protein
VWAYRRKEVVSGIDSPSFYRSAIVSLLSSDFGPARPDTPIRRSADTLLPPHSYADTPTRPAADTLPAPVGTSSVSSILP